MKVTNWRKKLAAAIVAAGIWVPGVAEAVNIPLGDASFENFAVPNGSPGVGYAYANTYRPTSAWVDDMDSPPGYTQDNSNSSWLYNASYAEDASAARKRAAPLTGIQAMHGSFNYSGQETVAPALFEAGKRYDFSIWSQGDSDASATSSRVFLYVFNGSVPFSEANSLVSKRFGQDTGDFNNRGAAMNQAQSQANWRQITLSYTVPDGSPAIGQPIGVGFWAADDACLDDATLSSSPIPEPSTLILVGMSGVTLLSRRRR